MNRWRVQIHGKAGDKSFEISVVNIDKINSAQRYFGWFDENKLLITHNGGPCHWPLKPFVWDKMLKLAQEVADNLNSDVLGGGWGVT